MLRTVRRVPPFRESFTVQWDQRPQIHPAEVWKLPYFNNDCLEGSAARHGLTSDYEGTEY
jgi:hypothetical protein